MSGRPVVAPPKGLRRFERWFVGVMMGIVAFVLEKVVLRSVTKKHPESEPAPTTITSKGGEVDLDELLGG